jgi:hypothetical protein
MPSRGLAPGARPGAAACVRAVRQRLTSVRGHERTRKRNKKVAVHPCPEHL